MSITNFPKLYEGMVKNIEELKLIVKKPENLNSLNNTKIVEKTKYLFYGLIKSLVNLGNKIIIENDFRQPLNTADIFISLAEHEIIIPSVIPGIKKAVLATHRINGCSGLELVELISESIVDLHQCLDSFAVYFNLKRNETQN